MATHQIAPVNQDPPRPSQESPWDARSKQFYLGPAALIGTGPMLIHSLGEKEAKACPGLGFEVGVYRLTLSPAGGLGKP